MSFLDSQVESQMQQQK